MSSTVLWTCDRCGTRKEWDGQLPPRWFKIVIDSPRESDIRENKHYHVCEDCTSSFREWVKSGQSSLGKGRG